MVWFRKTHPPKERKKLLAADLSEANLENATFSHAILASVDLSNANLRKANLAHANLSFANVMNSILCGANLESANLFRTDLTGTDLRGANLRGVDLTWTLVRHVMIREEDLDGVKYQPEQLNDMKIEYSQENSNAVLGDKAVITIRFKKENLLLLHLIQLTILLESFYDLLYLFMFSQYKSIDELREVLQGSFYHKMKNKPQALRIRRMATQSPPVIELLAQYSVGVLLIALIAFIPKEVKIDIYKSLKQLLFKTRKEKRQEEFLKAKTLDTYANILEKCRKLGETPMNLLPPTEKEKNLPPALMSRHSSNSSVVMNLSQEILNGMLPREDYLKTILLLRQEGLLTNPLNEKDLANLLEILSAPLISRYNSIYQEMGGCEIEIEIEQKAESKIAIKKSDRKKQIRCQQK